MLGLREMVLWGEKWCLGFRAAVILPSNLESADTFEGSRGESLDLFGYWAHPKAIEVRGGVGG